MDSSDRTTTLKLAFIAGIGVLISGCTGTHYRSFTLDSSPRTSLSVDARQRMILTTDRGGPEGNKRVVCAEPSPDAFTAASLSAALNAKVGPEQIGGGLSHAETAGALGMRTQTIQLLRDGLYRACEAYMNGVIEDQEYRKIISAYDELLITLVAVEGLTQQVRIPPPVIGSKASTTPAANGSGTSSDTKPSGSINVTATLPSDKVARQVHAIVRDYYCFQLGLKEYFYKKNLGVINQQTVNQLCRSVPVK